MARGKRVKGFVDALHDPGDQSVVTSVAATDTTLTITPTIGDVLAKINLSNANTWLARQQFDAGINVNSKDIDDFEGAGLDIITGTLNTTAHAGLDHGLLGGLTDDDHSGYPWLTGRLGGTVLIGHQGAGVPATRKLELQGSSHATIGFIRIKSQVKVDAAQANSSPEDGDGGAFECDDTFSTSAVTPFVLNFFRMSFNWTPTNTFTSSSLFEDESTINYGIPSALLSSITFAQIHPTVKIDNATNSIPTLIGMNFIAIAQSNVTGSVDLIASLGVNAAPYLQSTVAGGTLTAIPAPFLTTAGCVGLNSRPTWSASNATATVNFGNVIAVECQSPAKNLFGSDLGTKIIDDYIGLRYGNLDPALTENGDSIGFVSEIDADAAHWMLRNDGGAKSSFGLGSVLFGTVGSAEFEIVWDGTDLLEFKGSVDAPGNVGMNFNVEEIGFYGVTPATRQGATTDIKDALTTYGLLQGTSASPLNLDGGKLTCDEAEIDGALNHDGSTAGFYGTAPVTQASALTTALTSVTHTGPSTPDYALATPIDSSAGAAWGFSTQDEFETTMSVIANLQARQNEIETALANMGITA